MSQEMNFDYRDGNQDLEGFVALPSRAGKNPAVLIVHTWVGLGEGEKSAARRLAGLGYVGFGIDVFGKGRRGGEGGHDPVELIRPFKEDRAALGQRLRAAVSAIRQHAAVDAERLAIMGFCFGGMCALDVARSGEPSVKGAVSLHGNLDAPAGKAPGKVTAKVLALHGYEDPMVPPTAVLAFADEMRAARADWQLHAYGNTMHGFTNPNANDPGRGIQYNETSNRRAWISVENFLRELFGGAANS